MGSSVLQRTRVSLSGSVLASRYYRKRTILLIVARARTNLEDVPRRRGGSSIVCVRGLATETGQRSGDRVFEYQMNHVSRIL